MKNTSLKYILKIIVGIALLVSWSSFAQNHSSIDVMVIPIDKTLFVKQELTFHNQSNDTLTSVILNDWNNAYSSKETPLAKRFSDEFVRSFHVAKEEERGSTKEIAIRDMYNQDFQWKRLHDQPDLIEVTLPQKLAPNEKINLILNYTLKLPSNRFTNYGYGENGKMYLKNAFLTPARYENGGFIKYSNNNLDDSANSISDYDVTVSVPESFEITTDLFSKKTIENHNAIYTLSGTNRIDFSLFVEQNTNFRSFKKSDLEVLTDLKTNNVDEVRKALLINQMMDFVKENIGAYPHGKVVVSQADYDRNPFYGLNQLPSFLSPFPDDFLFEIKFLKTYLNNYLKTSLRLDPRKDNWIYDGMQMFVMMRYIDEFHPQSKMMGSVSKFRILKSYNLTNLSFNEQYSYFYMLMARKNLDQPIGDPKNTFIKFNEQIAGKYRSGLSFKYLDHYLENEIVSKSLVEFYKINQQKQTSREDLEQILKANSPKNIDWFFNTIVNSREIVDYKFSSISKSQDSVSFTIKNRTNTTVPIPVYGLKGKQVVFKEWYENISTDSTFTVERKEADRIVLNYKNEVPEFNLRNNWKSMRPFFPNNRPFKFVFMKDLEDPYYNQILYVPTVTYNLYDGISPGIRFHNKTILDKPFNFDVNPVYSANTQSLIGSFSFAINQYNRKSEDFNNRYLISGNYFHYAPDATYLKINPTAIFRFREKDFRDNRKRGLLIRQVMVNRQESKYDLSFDENNQNYSVFNAKYSDNKTEITKHFNLSTDLQLSSKFGKSSIEFGYRKLFNDNRQINVRFFAGAFLYNTTDSDFFSFALDRPTDYLFDYNYYGRSETSGLFSQQLIIAEGGFKSRLINPYANQWMATTNASFNIWNWVEIYGDAGFMKNKNQGERFVYDSGVRLNLVTDYFELYFPVYSNNGWEIADNNYQEKVRFIVTLSPSVLINLFTRKWF
uniref:aminopeptidase n=1 Tax=Flavobacterium soli TaxID=344881 RepID=UPI00316AECD9